MEPTINFPRKEKVKILSLGAESVGRFAFYNNGDIFISENFGDILDENNFLKYKKTVLDYLKKEQVKPDAIMTDLHPLYNSTILGEILAKKYKIPHIKVQHHLAHIFSAIGDYLLNIQYPISKPKYQIPNTKYQIPNTIIGIAADGTGYGLDGNIWGGEIFKFKVQSSKFKVIERAGSLEEQTMIGGDLAVREPARMLIAILAKLKTQNSKLKATAQNSKANNQKEFIYRFVKKHYSRNEFELLYSQLEQDFNCQRTTSTGRILDAAAVLLGFAENDRKYKHEAAKLLEENSTTPYNIKPRINPPLFPFEKELVPHLIREGLRGILQTTPLFQYLIKNYDKDKRRLAATAQLYLAKGFYEIIKKIPNTKYQIPNTYFAGGMANNKIISRYLEERGVYLSKKIPRGDEGIAFGQVVYYLLNNY